MMSGQDFYDALSRVARAERSKYQLTLGKLTEQLEQLVEAGNGNEGLAARTDEGCLVWLGELMSYRGYYSDLAFAPRPGVKIMVPIGVSVPRADPIPQQGTIARITDSGSSVFQVRERCRLAYGETFEGYKGGGFTMSDDTPLWIAEYGSAEDLALMPTLLVRDVPGIYVLNTHRPE